MSDYREVILKRMLDKLEKRTGSGRRVFLKPREVYRGYEDYNADTHKKQEIGEAALFLEKQGFLQVEYLPFSSDIKRMILVEVAVAEAASWLETECGVASGSTIRSAVEELIRQYEGEAKNSDGPVRFYLSECIESVNRPGVTIDPDHTRDVLSMLVFLENNHRKLYLREASMLVYGESKAFENETLADVCRVLAKEESPISDRERERELLESFHVLFAEQEIRIKGMWRISFGEETIPVDRLPGGIAISTQSFSSISGIVCGSEVMTIENKTSFERMPENGRSYLYLGGFATVDQTLFIKMVARMNPDAVFRHFGDIDAGGLIIHQTLCAGTQIPFSLYRMGVKELSDEKFESCLRPLTANDRVRLTGLEKDERYCRVVGYMLENNVKLEQEVVSLDEG